jgi:hypothetical protein
MGVEELQLAGVVRMHAHRQHLAPELVRQEVDMDEEVGAGSNRSGALKRKLSARYDHMQVRMVGECRSPGMERGGKMDPPAEALGIACDRERRVAAPFLTGSRSRPCSTRRWRAARRTAWTT